MRRLDDIISASEIGTWCYCKRAWHLQQLGHRSTLTEEQMAGNRYHRIHFQNLRSAHRQRAAARVVMIACVVLLITIGIVGIWSPH